ncbi:MAG: hypothetical protein ABJC07_04160 [Acidobacteriota bacterium]
MLRALTASLERRGCEGWLVGGAPRDILLGRPCPDLDAVIDADPFDVAAELSRAGFGTAVPLSDAAPRVARLAGSTEVDLAELTRGDIFEDLARRDFTVNAVAVSLSDRAWIDPHRGAEDLERGRLRMISAQNLREDPLRTLRAARFMAALGLVPDRATSSACRLTAPLLPSAAPERIRVELEKLLSSPRVVPALSWAAKADLLGAALGRPLSVRQAGSLVRGCPLDQTAVRRGPPSRRLERRLVLLAAGLRMPPEEAVAWLASRRFSRSASARIGLLLRLARDAGQVATADARWGWVRDAGLQASEALLLARLLPSGPPPVLAAVARSLRAARRPPAVTGGDILEWLRMAPGPRVGELLRQVEIEGVRGRVRSRVQARRWLIRTSAPVVKAGT